MKKNEEKQKPIAHYFLEKPPTPTLIGCVAVFIID